MKGAKQMRRKKKDMSTEDKMNLVYAKNKEYSSSRVCAFDRKLPCILEFTRRFEGTILDAGCGRGNTVEALISNGMKAYGIDFSKECHKRYLDDSAYECVSISDHAESGATYIAIVCDGVLEHQDYEDIDEVISSLASMSDNILLGIANHSDVQCGQELHPIQEDIDWWTDKLGKFYNVVESIISIYKGKYFIIECKGAKNERESEVESGVRVQED